MGAIFAGGNTNAVHDSGCGRVLKRLPARLSRFCAEHGRWSVGAGLPERQFYEIDRKLFSCAGNQAFSAVRDWHLGDRHIAFILGLLLL